MTGVQHACTENGVTLRRENLASGKIAAPGLLPQECHVRSLVQVRARGHEMTEVAAMT